MTDLFNHLPIGWIVAALAVVLVIAFLRGFLGGRSGAHSDDLQQQRRDSAVWATPKDVADLIVTSPDPRRLRLGRLAKKELANPPLRSLMVIAPSGAGKTPRVVVPIVLQHKGPAVVTSVKADVLSLTRHHRATQGPVWVFDPSQSAGPTGRWSPLTHITSWADALDAAKWLQESSRAGSTGAGVTDAKFWDDNARHLLAPLVYLAAQARQPMGVLASWVANLGSELEKTVKDALAGIDDDQAMLGPCGYWAKYVALEARTKATISTTAFSILEVWGHPLVASAVSVTADDKANDVIDIDQLLDSGGTLYLVAPASDQDKFTPVFETMVNAIVMNVEHRAHRNGGRPLNPPLLLALDEAANIAPPRKLDQIASKSAGEGIVVVSVWQDEGQVERIYGPPTARTVTSNHYARVYLPGIQDPETLDRLSRQIGQDRFASTSTNHGKDSTTSSTSWHDLPVAPAADLRQMPAGEAIVICGAYKPMRVRLPGWFEDPALRALVDPTVAQAFDDAFAAPSTRKRKAVRA